MGAEGALTVVVNVTVYVSGARSSGAALAIVARAATTMNTWLVIFCGCREGTPLA